MLDSCVYKIDAKVADNVMILSLQYMSISIHRYCIDNNNYEVNEIVSICDSKLKGMGILYDNAVSDVHFALLKLHFN